MPPNIEGSSGGVAKERYTVSPQACSQVQTLIAEPAVVESVAKAFAYNTQARHTTIKTLTNIATYIKYHLLSAPLLDKLFHHGAASTPASLEMRPPPKFSGAGLLV
jgi:hypothetical protein